MTSASDPEPKESAEQYAEFRLDQTDDEPRPVLLGRCVSEDFLGYYLRQIGRVPLLSAANEVVLAKRIEAGVLAQERLDLGQYEDRRRRRELEVLSRGGRTAFDEFVAANLRLVVSIAKRYTGLGVGFLDLIQEGNLALIHAVEKFDYRKGTKFSTYATWWIRQGVSRALADQARTVRLPVHLVEQVSRVRGQMRRVAATEGRIPSPAETARVLEIGESDVVHLLRVSTDIWSLDEPVVAIGSQRTDGEWDGRRWVVPLGRVIEDSEPPSDPEEAVAFGLLQEQLYQVLDTLSEREAGVVCMRFGLTDRVPRTLEEIGRVYGVTRERIRQIEKLTMDKLRDPSRSEVLRDYLD